MIVRENFRSVESSSYLCVYVHDSIQVDKLKQTEFSI
jgi:hypothetical protein